MREHPLMQYEIEVLGELIDFVEAMGRITAENVTFNSLVRNVRTL